MAQLSLRSALLIIAYVGICSLVYVSANIWIGWLVVIATACWVAIAMTQAFRTRNTFTLCFAVITTIWLIIWLGFAIQTPTTFPGWDIRRPIVSLLQFGREPPQFDQDELLVDSGHVHELYQTYPMMSGKDAAAFVPGWHNTIRLAVCLTALIAGCIGGFVFQRVSRISRSDSHNHPGPEEFSE